MNTRGVNFIAAAPPLSSEAVRLDAVLMVGLGTPHPGPLPASLAARLVAYGTPITGEQLYGLPVPISSWTCFEAWFECTRPIVGNDQRCLTPLAAAVRAFFIHGGRDLTVIVVGESPAAGAREAVRIQALEQLLFGSTGRWSAAVAREELLSTWLPAICDDITDEMSWHGIGRLMGLHAVALVALPDLVELTAMDSSPVDPIPVIGDASVTLCCAPAGSATPLTVVVEPRHDTTGFTLWVRLVNHIVTWIRQYHRTVQTVLSAPLPQKSSAPFRDPHTYLAALGCDRSLDDGGTASAFVVISGGWLAGSLADNTSGNLLAGDSVVAALLAKNSTRIGAWRSATNMSVSAVRVEPADGLSTRNILATRLCLLEQTANGIRLGSDVTTSLDSAWRPGMVCRLLSLVLRLAQRHGEEFVFAPSSERTWQQLVNRLDDILDVLTQRGALAAGRSEEAYSVTCNRTTMSQSDIDHGRLIVRMILRPAAPVEAIDVQLAVEGNSMLVAGGIL